MKKKGADRVLVELEAIRAEGRGVLRPEAVVDYARGDRTALHGLFTWDDSEAARQYRLWQAREIINTRVIVLPNSKKPVKAYVSLYRDRKAGGGYRAVAEVMTHGAMREEMLDEALKDLQVFEQKYKSLQALQPIFQVARRLRRINLARISA